jgi:hypothetical protein
MALLSRAIALGAAETESKKVLNSKNTDLQSSILKERQLLNVTKGLESDQERSFIPLRSSSAPRLAPLALTPSNMAAKIIGNNHRL